MKKDSIKNKKMNPYVIGIILGLITILSFIFLHVIAAFFIVFLAILILSGTHKY